MSAAAPAVAAPAAASVEKPKTLKTKRSPLNVTGVHVVKAALIAVLGLQCSTTQSAEYVHATKAEITVSYDGEDTLTPEQFAAVEAKANEFIAGDLALAHLPGLPEADWKDCPGPRAEKAGELKVLKLLKMRKRKAQKGYEFSFVVAAAAEELQEKSAAAVAATNSKKTQAVQQAAVAGTDKGKKAASTSSSSSSTAAASSSAAKPAAPTDYVVDTTQAIFHELILPAFAKLQSASSGSTASPHSLTPSELSTLRTSLLPQLETYLVMFANQAYTRGFTAHKRGAGNIDLARLL
jgi:alanyl-tRNA synthetase